MMSYILPDCSPTMIVFDVPSLTVLIRWPRASVMTPPSEMGPRNCELAFMAVGCGVAPRMHVYPGRWYPSSPPAPVLNRAMAPTLDGHSMYESRMFFQMSVLGSPTAPPNQNV